MVIETCGIGWKQEEITAIAQMPGSGQVRETGLAALSWIVSLDSANEERYRQLHGDGFNEAVNLVKILLPLFPNNVYVQALRCKGEEDDIEAFYRFWHTTGAQVIIQKHDNFCGTLPLLRAGDISPVVRMPCWHIMRDMPVYLDGTVFPCREGGALRGAPPAAGGSGEAEGFAARGAPPPLGNVFEDSLERIWQRGEVLYSEHCKKNYNQFCVNCDEYYTFNF